MYVEKFLKFCILFESCALHNFEVRLIKQVTNRELGLYTSIASARKTELNIELVDGVGKIVYI